MTTTETTEALPAEWEAFTLSGLTEGVEVRVTVEGVLDPATPPPASDLLSFKPGEGNKWIAVILFIESVGSEGYDDIVFLGAKLVDDLDQQHTADYFAEPRDCVRMDHVVLSPGDQRRGCVVFEVNEARSPSRLQWGPGMGMATGVAEWDL